MSSKSICDIQIIAIIELINYIIQAGSKHNKATIRYEIYPFNQNLFKNKISSFSK